MRCGHRVCERGVFVECAAEVTGWCVSLGCKLSPGRVDGYIGWMGDLQDVRTYDGAGGEEAFNWCHHGHSGGGADGVAWPGDDGGCGDGGGVSVWEKACQSLSLPLSLPMRCSRRSLETQECGIRDMYSRAPCENSSGNQESY